MKRIPLPLVLGTILSLLLAACAGSGVLDAGPIATDSDQDTTTDTDDTVVDPDQDEHGQDTSTDTEDDVPDTDGEPGEDRTGTSDDTDPSDATGTSDDATDASDADAGDDDRTDTSDDADRDDATDARELTQVRLYFVAPGGGTPGRADPFLVSVQREIPSTPGIARATLRELVEGPSSSERALIDGIATSVPAQTLVLGIDIADGLARVDLSREFESGGGSFSMFSRLAQVTYTLTQFPTVDEVEFLLDGQPVRVFSGEGITIDEPASRADFVDLLPTVFVDTPAAGAEADTPLRVTGMGAVFEATFQYRLETVDGTVLDEGFAMTDNGVGWGAFDITLDVSVDAPTEATLTVWEYSAKDGSVQALRATPLTLLP